MGTCSGRNRMLMMMISLPSFRGTNNICVDMETCTFTSHVLREEAR
jgi:hypothetical protein